MPEKYIIFGENRRQVAHIVRHMGRYVHTVCGLAIVPADVKFLATLQGLRACKNCSKDRSYGH